MKFGKDDWFLLLAQGAILILATLGWGDRPGPQGGQSTGKGGSGAGCEGGWWLMAPWDNMAQQEGMDFGTNDLGQVNAPLWGSVFFSIKWVKQSNDQELDILRIMRWCMQSGKHRA